MKIRRLICILLTAALTLPLISCSRAQKDGPSPGDPRHFKAENVQFTLRYAPAATFPAGLDNDIEATVEDPFWIGETEVTYELWYSVREWAEENGYTFFNRGQEGGQLGERGKEPSEAKNHPVTRINWFDAVVWCNALSEYLDLEPLYLLDGEVHRAGGTKVMFNLELRQGVGFRLPTNAEWELAARYQGSDRSNNAIEYPADSRMYWTPGRYASGASGPATDEEATMAAAWYKVNSAEDNSRTTHTRPVGQKPSRGNALNLYDMSGNVFEFMHDYEYFTHRGGCYYLDEEYQMISFMRPDGATSRFSGYPNLGMRLLLPTGPGRVPGQMSDADQEETEPILSETDEPDDPAPTESETEAQLFEINSLVEVQYGTVWYPAILLDEQNGEYFITYVGYDESWDEWAKPDRIRHLKDPPVIASVEPATLSIDQDTELSAADLPERVDVILENGTVLDASVLWDLSDFDTSQEGMVTLYGQFTDLPVNIVNRMQFFAAINLRVRGPDGAVSLLRTGDDTGVEDLLFYIENEDYANGYYFGIASDFDLTHLVIENPDKSFAAMIVFNEDLYPIQWVFPDLTIAILVDRGASFDPGEARHSFLYEEYQDDMVLDITFVESAADILERLPDLFNDEVEDLRSALSESLAERGWLNLPVSGIFEEAESPHDLILASMLSVVSSFNKISDGLDSMEADLTHHSDSSQNQIVRLDQLQSGSFAARPVFVYDVAREVLTGNTLPIVDIVGYGWRIITDDYGAGDIEGPAVSMLLCKGISTVPNVCNEFYFPNTPGNASRCVSMCYVSMSCFTDICHPKMFSANDAISLRRP